MAREAANAGLISQKAAKSVEGLARLRNLAVHGGEVSTAQALEFLALAEATLYAIDQEVAARELGP
ncbi:MAG: hypothetical protein ACT4QG_00165 [Sporichthyaceae bacterium]